MDELLLRGPGDQEDSGPEPLCEVTVNVLVGMRTDHKKTQNNEEEMQKDWNEAK